MPRNDLDVLSNYGYCICSSEFFLHISGQMVRKIVKDCGLQRRRDSKTTFAQLVRAMSNQALCGAESLGYHLRLMTGINISDAAAIAQRACLNWTFYEQLFARILRPLAKPHTQPESFYKGMRLLAIDGVRWSLRNTASVRQLKRQKHTNQKGASAAFLKWNSAVLLELGTHQPLAVACSTQGLEHEEGELPIARRTLAALPHSEPSLLLADRLYGHASFILDVQEASANQTQLLVRVRSNLKGKQVRVLSDGSALIEVKACGKGATQGHNQVVVREVRALVQRTGSKAVVVRLWTTLLDEERYPASELIALYTQRWEHELFYRELKHHVAGSSLLKAGSEHTAQGELAGMIMAASIIAQQRMVASEKVELPPVRLSLLKIGRIMASLSVVLNVGEGIISAKQREELICEVLKHMAKEAVIPPRTGRSCQRAVRRAVSPWPVVKTRSKADPTLSVTLIPHL